MHGTKDPDLCSKGQDYYWCQRIIMPNMCIVFYINRNVPKFLDIQIWANSADPDQTAPRGAVWSGSTLFAIPSASFGYITLRKRHLVQLLGWLQQIFWVSEHLGNLRYKKNPTKIFLFSVTPCTNNKSVESTQYSLVFIFFFTQNKNSIH